MAANQIVFSFDTQEDALLFAVAAGSVMSADGPVHSSKAAIRVAEEVCKPVESRLRMFKHHVKGGKIK
jgi:hypothetical protein